MVGGDPHESMLRVLRITEARHPRQQMTSFEPTESPAPAALTEDFREIAHSGGKIIFDISVDHDGRPKYRVTSTGSRPVPMSMFAIYALPEGIPVANILLGGIGQSWNPPPYPSCIPVFIVSDSGGYFGHQCPECEKYWRSGTLVRVCPYCGVRGEAFRFLTPAHLAYVSHYTRTLLDAMDATQPGQSNQVTIDMAAIVDGAVVPKPEFYYPGTSQQTRFKCVHCGVANYIRGRYGFCSRCGWRNNLADLQAHIEIVRADMNAGRLAPEEAVKKIVSVFDACCRDWAAQLATLPMRPHRQKELLGTLFHGIDAADVLKRTFDIDLLKGMDHETGFLRLMFQRRHVFEHEGGVATRRYLNESGDKSITEGTLIRETRENAHRLASCIVRMATNFETGFHEIFPPVEDQKAK
jgi:hypothetical protein